MSGLGGQTSLLKPQVKKLRVPVRSGFGSFGRTVFRKPNPFSAGFGNKDPHHQYDTFMLRSSASVRLRPLCCSAKPSSSPPEAKDPGFYIGIQHGAMLAISGLIHFVLSRSMLGIVFGVSPGCLILFSSIHYLNTCKKGNSARNAMISTAASASVLYLWELWLLLKEPTDSGYLAVLSGVILLVYICRILHTLWKTRREQPLDDQKKE